MLKIHIDKIKNYEFNGFVHVEDLTEPQREALGVTLDDVVIDAYGSFDVHVTEDEGHIDGIDVSLFLRDKQLDLNETQYDDSYLSDQLESRVDFRECYQDQQDSLADRMYDYYREGLYDDN